MCVELSRELGPILLKSIHVYTKPSIISILFSETKTPHFRRWPRVDMYIIVVRNSIHTKRSLKIDVVYRKKKPNNSWGKKCNASRGQFTMFLMYCVFIILLQIRARCVNPVCVSIHYRGGAIQRRENVRFTIQCAFHRV